MKYALFWDVAQLRLSVSDVSGQPIVPSSGVKQLKFSWTALRQLRTKLLCVTFQESKYQCQSLFSIISYGSSPCSHIFVTGTKRIFVIFLIDSSIEGKSVS